MRLKTNVFLIGILISFSGYSLPEDKQKPIYFSANTAHLDQLNHKGSYQGAINFDQGSTHIRGEFAVTKINDTNQLTYACIQDNKNLAHYWTQTALDKPVLHAYAKTIRYYPQQRLVILIGQAKIIQGHDEFSGFMIRYDGLKQQIFSKGNQKNKSAIIFYPKEHKA